MMQPGGMPIGGAGGIPPNTSLPMMPQQPPLQQPMQFEQPVNQVLPGPPMSIPQPLPTLQPPQVLKIILVMFV